MRSLPHPGRSKTAAICYALGWTQHSKGVQIIRTAAILQLLLGNIGRPGGGILALRGHASIQGSTDIPTLYDILPGYLTDAARRSEETLAALSRSLHEKDRPLANYSELLHQLAEGVLREDTQRRKTISATAGFPKLTGNHSFFEYLYDMARRKNGRHVFDGPEPGRRRAELAVAAESAFEIEMAGRA